MASTTTWAQLVCTTDTDSEPIPIKTDKFTIGRAKNCSLCVTDNKMISSHHCHIERAADGTVWLQDTSTNGTLLNLMQKLSRIGDKRAQIHHGDEFHVVYKKGAEDMNLGYLFQDMKELEKEEMDATQEYSSDVETTSTGQVHEEGYESDKRLHTEPSKEEGEPALKRRKTEEDDDMVISTSHGQEATDAKCISQPQQSSDSAAPLNTESDPKKQEQEKADETDISKTGTDAVEAARDELQDTLMCIICQEIFHDCISLQPCMHSFCAGCYSDWMDRSNECPSCRMKVERINKNHLVNNLVEAYLKEHPDKKRSEEDLKDLNAKNKISRDMLYPAGPVKRPIEESDSDLDDNPSDEQDSDSNSDSDASDSNSPPFRTVTAFGTPIHAQVIRPPKTICRQCPEYIQPIMPFGTMIGQAVTAVGNVISQAVNLIPGLAANPTTATNSTAGGGNADNGAAAVPGTSTNTASRTDEAQPSTSGETSAGGSATYADVKVMPTPPNFVCSPNQTHILCQCCLQPMPDRRSLQTLHLSTGVPPMQCSLCYRFYCHAYWGCRKVDCLGCLGNLKDLHFGKKCLGGLILENAYESTIFQNYLENQNITVKQVLQECCAKLDSREYACRDQAARQVNSNTVMCFGCGLRNFRDLAYLYRRDIPIGSLPDTVTNRPNCYWGKNCRTQRNKPQHAMNFNRICEQTRTAT